MVPCVFVGITKTTVNQCAIVDHFPLPNGEDLFTTLAGGESFARLIHLMPISKLNGWRIPEVSNHQHSQVFVP